MRGDGELKPPIFLLGNVRSGTSMSMFCFDAHPGLCVWNEPRTVWTYADPARRHDRFTEEDATARVRRYIRGRFLRHQREHAGRRVMEKTPSNVMRARYMHAIFPESRFVYLVREPLANLRSSEAWWRRGAIGLDHLLDRLRETPKTQLHYYAGRLVTDMVRTKILKQKYVSVWGVRYRGIYEDLRRLTKFEIVARQWVECCRAADEDLGHLPPEIVLRVKYEDLVADPVAQFGRIFEHFGETLVPEVESWIRENVDAGRRAKWKRLDPEMLRAAIPHLADEMARQGYEIPAEVRDLLEGRITDEAWREAGQAEVPDQMLATSPR